MIIVIHSCVCFDGLMADFEMIVSNDAAIRILINSNAAL